MLGIGDILRVVMSWNMPDQVVAQLVWHYLITSGSGGDEQNVLANIQTKVRSAFNTILADISDQVSAFEYELFKWDPVLNQFDGIASTVETLVDGANINQMLPHGTGPMVFFHTDVGRRRGRKFLIGYTEEDQDEGTLSAAAGANLVNFVGVFNDDVLDPNVTLSPGNFNVDPTSPLFETFAEWSNTAGFSTVIAYQRRRKAGVGI